MLKFSLFSTIIIQMLPIFKDCPELFLSFPTSCLRDTFCEFAKNLWNKKHTHHNSTCVNVHGSVNKGDRKDEGASHFFWEAQVPKALCSLEIGVRNEFTRQLLLQKVVN